MNIPVNEYFDGNVKSLTFHSGDRRATLGVVLPGEYEFGASEKETMQVVSGQMQVQLPNTSEFAVFEAGGEFIIEPGQKFQLKAESEAAYLCIYG